MLGELAVFEADDVGGDPGGRTPDAGETAVGDDVVAFGDDQYGSRSAASPERSG